MAASLAAARGPRPLSPRMRDLLRHGDRGGRYPSPSSVLQALVTAYVTNGWPADAAWAALWHPRNAGGAGLRKDRKGRPRGEGSARRQFARDWDKAERFAAANPAIRERAEAIERIATVGEAARSAVWRGRGGATDRMILEAVVRLALRCAKVSVDASVRDVAVEAGVGVSTASRALGRLGTAGWLRRTRQGRGAKAATWRLQIPRTLMEHTELADAPDPLLAAVDAFRWTGLGWSVGRVWSALGLDPLQPADLARAFGVQARTTRRHLARLAVFDLAVRSETGWVRGPADPADVARDLGTLGSQDAQRERIRRDRENRARAFEERDR